MPRLPAERVKEIGEGLLVAAGAPAEEAETVMRHCVNANLAGHDSHGIIMIPSYIERVKVGHIVPGAPWKIVQESPTTTVVDGHWGFGYVVNERAMKYTIEKARTANVAAATVFRQGHIGRLASYPLMAAEQGMIGLITADSGRSPKGVAPFGGAEARLGTNPISIAVPSDLGSPLFLDMATSAVAAGKIALAVARKQEVPLGWIIDKDGGQTTDPTKHRQGGALLPLGGSEGYKGYGLAVIVEILCGLLTGLGFGVEPTGRHNDGCFMAVFKVDAFRPLAQFKKDVAEFARYLNDTKPAEGFDRVYYPGEIEHLKEVDRRKSGIEVEDATWQKLCDLANSYGVAAKLGLS
ncbi:MAG: Ldh family oxidoreductase [Alphaproteobacteria bacterium]|nr:Ldh family oxidoreductase [Alphaproteobacteria bacterium]